MLRKFSLGDGASLPALLLGCLGGRGTAFGFVFLFFCLFVISFNTEMLESHVRNRVRNELWRLAPQ